MSNPEKTNGKVSTEPVPTEVQEPGQRRVYTAEYKPTRRSPTRSSTA